MGKLCARECWARNFGDLIRSSNKPHNLWTWRVPNSSNTREFEIPLLKISEDFWSPLVANLQQLCNQRSRDTQNILSARKEFIANLLRLANLLFLAARDEWNETDGEVVTVKLGPWPRYARCPRNERENEKGGFFHARARQVLRQDTSPSTSSKTILSRSVDGYVINVGNETKCLRDGSQWPVRRARYSIFSISSFLTPARQTRIWKFDNLLTYCWSIAIWLLQLNFHRLRSAMPSYERKFGIEETSCDFKYLRC